MEEIKESQEIRLDEMMERIREKLKPEYDLIVAIARGGILPGYLASRFLDLPLEILHLNLRNDQHQKVREEPLLLKPLDFSPAGKRILLTDDVANSGSTLKKAAALLPDSLSVQTMVISGNGDISLFGPHDRCIRWPWSL
jgi:hypothetical protein